MTELIRAKVVMTTDHAGRDRVQLAAPRWGQNRLWADVLRPGGGIAPAYKIGDIVIVGFEDGDPQRPVVLGALKRS